MFSAEYLALLYSALMALAIIVYAVLDGYDLGVGILLPGNNKSAADTMIASIGPFWDANETWLVLAVGLALIAFPTAHSIILQALYLPIAFMLLGLILRGVAFDFRAKAKTRYRRTWDRCFKLGSLITAFSQGYMLGLYVMSFEHSIASHLFAALSGVGVIAAYTLIGAGWLIMKCEGEIQSSAIRWCRLSNLIALLGVLAVSMVNPLINAYVQARWFGNELSLLLLPLPLFCMVLFILQDRVLVKLERNPNHGCWLPFAITVIIFLLCFFGLVYSFFLTLCRERSPYSTPLPIRQL